MNPSTFDGFMMTFWGVLVGCLCIVVIIHLATKTILTKKFTNPIKKKVLLALIVLILPSLFLTILSVFDLHLHINQAFHSLPKLIKKIIFPIINHIVSFSQTPWPKYALAATISGILGMILLPRMIERIHHSFLKHLLYTVLSLGLYLPYKLISLIFDHSSSEVLKRGTKVIHNPRESVQIIKKRVSREKPGIKIHPQISLPLEMESKHILIMATIGAGKTQIIMPMVDEIIKRKDRMLIYDRKGDFTEAFGEDEGVLILSPFDARGVAWDIGKDIRTEILAEEFAASLIPSSSDDKDSVWSEAAQDVLTGILKRLQVENGESWGFHELSTILNDKNEIIQSCKDYHPGALQNFGNFGEDDRQTTSVLLSLRTAVKRIDHLAKAWSSNCKKFSLLDWIANDKHQIKTIIISGNPRYSGLDKLLVSQFFNMLFSEILALPDSRDRRIWAINDEQGSQPKIPMMLNGLTEGRSKGLRIISAVQSVSQIKRIYGREGAEAWFNSFGTLFGGRVGDSDTASFLAKAFGVNRIEKVSTSIQESNGHISRSRLSSNDPALLDSDFLSISNPSTKKGIDFWLRVAGWPACKLNYPIKQPKKRYEAKLNHNWLNNDSRYAKIHERL